MRRRDGFTLIELLASAVLASLLMVGLVNIVWSIHRDTVQLKSERQSSDSITLLVKQIRDDIQNARGVAIQGNAVTLAGYLSQDKQDLTRTLLPDTVRYELAEIGNRRCLVRTTANGREVVWIGLGRLQIESLEFADSEDKPPVDATAAGLLAMPSILRATMTSESQKVLWRETIYHHEL